MAPLLSGAPHSQPQATLRSWLVLAALTGALTLGALVVIRLVRPSAIDGVLASSNTVEAQRGKARSTIKWIHEALLVYAHEHAGAYPAQLDALVEPGAAGKSHFGELRTVPLDPWNRPFHYEPPTAQHPRPRLTSLGADGQVGGAGENADIDSDTLPLDR